MTVVDPGDVLAMTSVVLTLAWLGFLVDGWRIGKYVPGVVVVLVLGLVLTNTNLVPFESAVTAFIGQYVVAAAIPLLMIKADLKKIFVESGRVMIGFAAACVGVVVGVLVGFFLLQPWNVTADVAGYYAGAFIGGTISMVAVGNALQMSASEMSAATGASMIPSVMGLMALVAVPTLPLVRRMFPPVAADGGADASVAESSAANSSAMNALTAIPELRPTHVAGALALAFAICWVSKLVEDAIGRALGHDQSQYHILYVTVLTVVVANVFPRQLQRLKGEFELGMICMYLFFAMIGLGTNITSFLDHAVSLFFYVILLLAVGIVVSLVLSRLLRLTLPEAVTGCGAAIVGPVATVAVVAGKGWHSMISPAVMTGIFCHIVGNFVGISVAALLS